jgi:hypothetical protein
MTSKYKQDRILPLQRVLPRPFAGVASEDRHRKM